MDATTQALAQLKARSQQVGPTPPGLGQSAAIGIYNAMTPAMDWSRSGAPGLNRLLGPAVQLMAAPTYNALGRAAGGEHGVFAEPDITMGGGLANPLNYRLTKEAGEAGELIAPMVNPAGRALAQLARAPKQIVQDIARASGSGLPRITVSHGTPHRWAPEPGYPQGRPRLDKMGSGQGAQAWGSGIYFAGNPAVSKSYQENLTDIKIEGLDPVDWLYELRSNGNFSLDKASAVSHLQLAKGDVDKAKSFGGVLPEVATELEALRPLVSNTAGSHYKLDLPDESLSRLLDFDTPLHSQPEPVKDALRSALAERGRSFDELADMGHKGESLFRMILGGTERENSRALLEHGILGTKYKDQLSRQGGRGANTDNYVVWDQGLLNQMPILGVE